MTGNRGIEIISLPAKNFTGKGITDFKGEAGGNRQPEVDKFAMHAGFCLGKIDECQGKLTSGQMTEKGEG